MSALSLSVLTPCSSVEPSSHGWTDSEDDQELEVVITCGSSSPDSDTDSTQTTALSFEPPESQTSEKRQFCCKLLVPSHYAGPILGRGGRNLLAVEKHTNTSVHISPAGVFFPGTEDRMLMIFAETLASLVTCMEMVVQQMRGPGERQKQHVVSKLVVPNSSVSKIIGRRGCHLQQVKESTGCRVSISQRNEGIQERVVLLGGDGTSRLSAAAMILTCVQEDPHLHEHMYFEYEIELPRGCWDCCKSPQNQASGVCLHQDLYPLGWSSSPESM
ncbi:NOVA2 [Symbiodinium sp. CCMP2592]|nr:NOVA2 [Symbiodinium sp. CCMP2592]